MKFNCKDELVELLKQYGYNLVRLPRENIKPLQILTRSNTGTWARLKDVFTSPSLDDTHALLGELFTTDSQPLPTAVSGDVVNDLKGKRSSEMSVEAAAELMVNFMNLGEGENAEGEKLKIEAALQSVKQVSFSFGEGAASNSISLMMLDAYLRDALLRDNVGNSFREWIADNKIYIITSVLSANSFDMKGSSEQNASATINVPKVQEVLQGKINGSVDLFEQSGLKYKGKKGLVFGFKAVRLIADQKDGKWIYKIENKDGLALKGEEDISVDVLEEASINLIDLN